MRWAWPRATYVEWLENVEMHQADHQLHRDVYGHTLRDRTGDRLSSWGANRQSVHSYVQARMHSHLRQLQSEDKRPFPTLWGDPSVLHGPRLLTHPAFSQCRLSPDTSKSPYLLPDFRGSERQMTRIHETSLFKFLNSKASL